MLKCCNNTLQPFHSLPFRIAYLFLCTFVSAQEFFENTAVLQLDILQCQDDAMDDREEAAWLCTVESWHSIGREMVLIMNTVRSCEHDCVNAARHVLEVVSLSTKNNLRQYLQHVRGMGQCGLDSCREVLLAESMRAEAHNVKSISRSP